MVLYPVGQIIDNIFFVFRQTFIPPCNKKIPSCHKSRQLGIFIYMYPLDTPWYKT